MRSWLFWGVAVLSLSAHAGDIYVCKGAHGVNTYQNVPCAKSTDQLKHRTFDQAMARTQSGTAASNTFAPSNPYATQTSRISTAYGSGAPAAQSSGKATSGGIGSTAYQRGEVQATRCVNAQGRAYYTRGGCGASTTVVGTSVRDWHQDNVRDAPNAVMIGPDQAVDPMTGQVMQLDHENDTVPLIKWTRDQGAAVNADDACAAARRAAAGRFNKAADDQVQQMCRFGRSMYDQPRSGRP